MAVEFPTPASTEVCGLQPFQVKEDPNIGFRIEALEEMEKGISVLRVESRNNTRLTETSTAWLEDLEVQELYFRQAGIFCNRGEQFILFVHPKHRYFLQVTFHRSQLQVTQTKYVFTEHIL